MGAAITAFAAVATRSFLNVQELKSTLASVKHPWPDSFSGQITLSEAYLEPA